MLAPTTHQYCPSSSSQGCSGNTGTDFEQSTECCDGTPFDFQQCGSPGAIAAWDPSTNPGRSNGPAHNGLQCLLHTTNNGPAPDSINVSSFVSNTGPLQISPGGFTQTRYSVSANSLIGTSDSIITVPLFDNRNPPASSQVTIVGFLQVFVNGVGQNGGGGGGLGPGDLDAYILNVVGCGSSASSSAVSGGGSSPVPVRLIHN
jgi:hypothetical protein